MRSTSLHGEEEHREHRVSLQRHRLPRECVAYIQPCRYDAWLWLPPQDPAAKPPPNRRPLWLPLHCAAARQEASLRFVPRQPNPQKKEQHQENYHASLPASFSPYCSLIKGTKTVQEMLARRGSRGHPAPSDRAADGSFSESQDPGAFGWWLRGSGSFVFSGLRAESGIPRQFRVQRSCDILLHLAKCLKILENRKSNLSLRASRFHSWRLRLREPRQLQRALVAKLSSA